MNVRCGACRTQFEVAGPGRFACPVCGSVNVVREGAPGAAPGPAPGGPPGGYPAAPGAMPPEMGGAPPPPPPPPPPMPKVDCPECDFTFIVGQIAKAECPNCGAEVDTGIVADEVEE